LCYRGSQKYNHEWVLQQLREVWTKNFISSAAAEDDVQEDDVEMKVRASTVQRYGNPKALDQLEEWMKEKPIPYISNDKFSQEVIFDYWAVRLPGHAHVNQTYGCR
jgi:hypothetical protein